jgi:hypothetical protein
MIRRKKRPISRRAVIQSSERIEESGVGLVLEKWRLMAVSASQPESCAFFEN